MVPVCVDRDDPCDRDPIAGTPFNEPVLLDGVMTAAEEDDPTLTGDMLELYMLSATELYVTRRSSTLDAFAPASPVPELNTTLTELRPCVSTDGLTIFFARRSGANDDIYVATRRSRHAAWDPPTAVLGNVNTADNELPAWISPDASILVFEAHTTTGQHDLFIARRPNPNAPFVREVLDLVNLSTSNEGRGGFNNAGTIFMFESNRGATFANVWEAFFDGAGWVVVAHPELDTAVVDGTPWLSPDGRTIVYSSNRGGNNDNLWTATR